MKITHAVLSSLLLLLFGLRAEATIYTVKVAGGGNFTTIAACSGTAVAGDVCDVFAGSYSGWTQNTSGGAGNPITFTGHAGNTVTITSAITISSRSYLTFSGLALTAGFTGNGSTQHVTITGNTFSGTGTKFFNIPDGLGSGGSDNVFSSNTITSTSTSTAPMLYVYGDRNRIESNTMSGGEGDCMELGGQNVVVRNNSCTGVNGASGEHIDFIQVIGGGTSPTLSFSLVEGNTEGACTNDGGNCHFIIVRTGSGPVADTVIVRYNAGLNLNAKGPISIGGVGDSAPNAHIYNNTMGGDTPDGENGSCFSFQNANGSFAKNNICYNTTASGWSPSVWATSTGSGNGNLAYTSGVSSFGSSYSGEATYGSLHNQNPKFLNYLTNASIDNTSPAYNAGVALTTVAAGDSGTGTSLHLTDAHYFQPGWAGTKGDWVCVTTVSNCGQISSIDYTTNIATLTGSLTRGVGDSVWLYKNSSGVVVLNGSAPDVGAFEVGGGGGAPTAPTGLSIH